MSPAPAHLANPLAPARAARPGARFLAAFLLALVALAGVASAQAPTVLVHQFDSQDVVLGAALAAEVADALEGSAVVLGPEVAPAAIPPLVVEGGFINPARVVAPEVMFGPAGADLLRGATGVDVAVTGHLEERDDRLSLFVSVAHAGGLRSGELTAAPSDPARLAYLAAALVGSVLDDQFPEGAPHYLRPTDPPAVTGGFDRPYGAYARAVALAAAGLHDDARVALEEAIGGEGVPERASEFLADLEAATGGEASEPTGPTSLARRALLSVQVGAADIAEQRDAFGALHDATGLPAARAWQGALAASVNDRAGAEEAFAAADYDYGVVARHSFLRSRGADSGEVRALLDRGDASGAALLAAALGAELAGDEEVRLDALAALTRASPFLAYPLEALSYHYFDVDDGRRAAEALAVAVELEPESDLYWTNLGWAYYLIGALEASEEASLTALSLDGTQSVAAYNLGLVRTVTGRLADAVSAYEQALRYDPQVNDEAIEDLQNALALYPNEPGIHYSLGMLLEADGRRQEARAAYDRFLQRAGDHELAAAARSSLEALSAPLPPLEIVGSLRFTLGARGPESAPFHPGDDVHPAFELSTPGDALPGVVDVEVTLRREGEAGEPLLEAQEAVQVPAGAVGFVVDQLALSLPEDLAPGTYEVSVTAVGGEGQEAAAQAAFEVVGGPEAIRQLLSRNLTMTDLQAGRALYGARDVAQPDALVGVLIAELRFAASAAEEALPAVEAGRFEGMSGGAVFRESTEQDVRDFLDYVLSSGSRDARFAFVDAYAQWALDGAP